MTTEIAVLNRLGVALATDSAVTISRGNQSKVFNTADKLFELSCEHPIAIMINGNMDLLGVPWEILIKDFRENSSINPPTPITVGDCASSFLLFAQNHGQLDKLTNDQVIDRIAENEIQLIRSSVINYFVDANKGFSISEANNLVPGFSVTRTATLDMMGVSAAHSQFSVDSIVERYGDKLRSIVIDSLKPVNIDAESVGIVVRQIATAIITVVKDESSTGLIFAGYSDNQTFPCLYNIDVSGLFDGCLKHSAIEERVRVDADKSGHVVSFAQTDVIDRLLEGVDPRFVENSGDFIQNHVAIVAKALSEYGKKRRTSRAERSALKSLVEDLAKDAKEQYYKVAKDMQNVLRIEFERMIAMMPKVELIELAEALVSITAIERKATSDQGTVGGPIDVAFLTRHEGFVWIKRKHYFSAALNPRYFWRKFGFARREG